MMPKKDGIYNIRSADGCLCTVELMGDMVYVLDHSDLCDKCLAEMGYATKRTKDMLKSVN